MYKEKERLYGVDAKIGLIYIASSWIMEPEFNMMSPAGVITCTTRISLGNDVSQDSLLNLGGKACEAAALLAEAPMDVIVLGCTSGSFIGGNDYDLNLIKSMEDCSSTRCTTTGRSVVEALNSLNLKNVAVLTPYTEDINEKCVSYLQMNNVGCTSIHGLGLTKDYDIDMVPLDEVKDRVLSLKGLDASDGIFISCTGLKTVPIIEDLEKITGLPVVTAVQATFWNCLKIAEVDTMPGGFGKLFNC